jgi:hypothetical protein
LSFGEEVLDQVARAVEVWVVLSAVGTVDFGGDGDFNTGGFEDVDHALLGIVGAVGEQRAEPADYPGQQRVGAVEIVKMARRQVERDRVAEGIAQRVKLGAQSAFASPDRFLAPVPPFAPALAWCAQMIVASIIAYSLSLSPAKCSKSRCQTPLRLHRM